MEKPAAAAFERRTLDELTIEDERSFRHVGVYAELADVLRKARYTFRVLPSSGRRAHPRADRALLLNLTFWAAEAGGDVLADDVLDADVVAHVAWHHLAARALLPETGNAGARLSVDALFLGEAIASAFDLYLVGRLLGHAPDSSFLESQVPAMADSAAAAGLADDAFEEMLEGVAADPERAFADLRELLFDVTRALHACDTAEQALVALASFDGHRFSSLIHRYELSNWVLYARAYGGAASGSDPRALEVDRALRATDAPLDWLVTSWVRPAAGASAR